ncbi:MAG: hypothetical protein K6B70_05680 [Clostridia bacterium]|nr:hypothetical protein [Clostridia bacterium]
MAYRTSYSTKELQGLLAELEFIKAQGREIQKNFDFTIPDYILEEIVLTRNKLEKLSLQIMINMAVLNKRITNRQANKLKNAYCK